MMLGNKESADMGRLFEYMKERSSVKLEIEHSAHIAPDHWSAYIYDPSDYQNPFVIFNAVGVTYSEALAKLSKLVYEEQLKTKG